MKYWWQYVLWFLVSFTISWFFGWWSLLILIALGANAVIGAAVICALDKDDVLYNWVFESLPFIRLQAWPIIALTHKLKPKG